MNQQQVVLLTGASAGIGKSAAELLMLQGVIVYGASRSGSEAMKNPDSKGKIIPVKMDVNDEENIQSVIQQIIAEQGRLDAVVCNAGNGIAGSIEDTSIEEAKYQFETNFFGVVKTIQACLPVFRSQGYGKIITISSVAGIVPIPFQAFYSAVKAALLLFMNALSLEVKPYGIKCSTILPGDTKTSFTSSRKYTKQSQSENSVYYQTMKASVSKMEKDEQNGMNPLVIAKAIVREFNAKHMHTIYVPGFQYQAIHVLFNILPSKFKLWVVGKLYA